MFMNQIYWPVLKFLAFSLSFQWKKLRILRFVDRHPCIISQVNPTRCTIVFNIRVFIYFSFLHVSGIHVPIISRKLLYPCDIVICHSVGVASVLLVGLKVDGLAQPVSIQPADQTSPIQSEKYQCRVDTVIFS